MAKAPKEASLKKRQAKTPKSKRSYNNASREEASAQNRQVIIQTLVDLLVEKKGGDVTFSEIAKRSGLAERSIYRFYNDKAAMHTELDQYLTYYVQSSVEKLQDMSVSEFAKNAFYLFDQYESLVLAYVYSPFGREARQRFHIQLNKLIEEKLLKQKPMKKNQDLAKKVAVICSLINAKIWHDIREDFGYSGAEMGDTIKWAIESLIKEI